jgi:hypothetical protein
LSVLQKCIIDSEDNFYPRDEKVNLDLALFEEQYKDNALKQTTDIRIGYTGIKKMFDNYKHIHPFFESQLSKSLSEFNDNLDKLELEKKQQLEEERKKQEELNKKKEIEDKANKLKELARKAIDDEQKVQERKQLIDNQLIENEKDLDNLQTGGDGDDDDDDADADADDDDNIDLAQSNNSMDTGNTSSENQYGLDKIYLDKAKYKDLEYIYLINQGCEMFHKKNAIWSNNPRKKINIMFENDKANINESFKSSEKWAKIRVTFGMNVKSLMETIHPNDDYSTTMLNKEEQSDYKQITNLESCSEYRLRCLNKDDAKFIGYFTINMKKHIQKSRSVWTIQKNIYMIPTDEESYDRYKEDFVSKWVDLSVVKVLYPDKLTTLDNMLLDKQAHKRRRALESLIKYATYGNPIHN